MKKSLFLVAVLTVFGAAMAIAQPRAIGGRLGPFNGVSYEHGFGDSNMLEIELGWGYRGHFNGKNNMKLWGSSVQLAVTYDWIDPFGANFESVWEHKGEWHWYMGVGGAGGYGWYGYAYVPGYGWNGGTGNWGFAGAAGRVGVEYDFWFPLQLSVDYRPTIGVGLVDNGAAGVEAGAYWDVFSIALGVRYKF